ncbi:MAG: hypothetical protein LH473_00340 [Chitinophagales bacterium]|nr:hypothetical protein [Chitinophagales bacterium]
MKAIVVNDMKSKISPLSESIALRLGYILANEICSAGDSYIHIDLAYLHNSMTFETRVRVLQDEKEKREKTGEEESKVDYSLLLKSYKQLKKIKSKSKQDIVLMRQVEKTVNETFAELNKETYEKSKQMGMIQLEPVFREYCFLSYPTDISDPEKEEGFYYPMSKTLQGIFPADKEYPERKEQPTLFFLTFEFFLDDFYKIFEEQEKNNPLVFLQHCFTFSNVNLCSVIELQVLRKRFNEVGEAWQNKMNEWIDLVCSNTTSTKSFFEKEVLPLAEAVNKEAENNILLKHISNMQNHEVSAEVWIGTLSISLLWENYRFHNVLSDNTWEKLMKAKEDNPIFNGYFPVMIVRVPPQADLRTMPDANAEVKAVKKKLDVD